MIPGCCFTNLDDYGREEWPEWFLAVPRVGDRVESMSGKSLRVVGVTHRIMTKSALSPRVRVGEPYIRIELHR